VRRMAARELDYLEALRRWRTLVMTSCQLKFR
jgi:hypothetical protein